MHRPITFFKPTLSGKITFSKLDPEGQTSFGISIYVHEYVSPGSHLKWKSYVHTTIILGLHFSDNCVFIWMIFEQNDLIYCTLWAPLVLPMMCTSVTKSKLYTSWMNNTFPRMNSIPLASNTIFFKWYNEFASSQTFKLRSPMKFYYQLYRWYL